MIRLILYAAIILSCFMCSTDALNCMKKRIETSRELEEVIFKMDASIKYGAYDVYRVCELAFSDVKSFDASGFMNISSDFSESFRNECKSIAFASEKTMTAFLRISEFLGMYEVETQSNALTLAADEIRLDRQDMESEYRSKSKLYQCIGAFSGIVMCLVLM